MSGAYGPCTRLEPRRDNVKPWARGSYDFVVVRV